MNVREDWLQDALESARKWAEDHPEEYRRRSAELRANLAYQAQHRQPGSVYDSQGYCDNPGRGF